MYYVRVCARSSQKKTVPGEEEEEKTRFAKKHHVSVVAVGPRVIREGGKLYVALAAEVLVHNLERA